MMNLTFQKGDFYMKKWEKKLMVFFIFLIASTIITGCWNNRDLAEISFAVAFGLDKTEDDKIEFTVQLVRPSGMQRDGGGGEKSFWVNTSIGDTVFEAIRNQLTTVNRKIYGNHLQLVVIGEELAKEGIQDVMDIFERDQEVNSQANVLVTKGVTAKEVLQAESNLEDIPGIHLVDIMDNDEAIAKMKKIILFDLFKEMGSLGREPVIGLITLRNQEQKEKLYVKDLIIEGASVFKDDQLVGWLNSVETRGYLFLTNKVNSTILNIPNPLQKNKKVAIEVMQSNTKLDVELRDGRTILIIEVNQEGNIGDQQGVGDLTKKEMLKELEEETEKVIENEIRDVLNLAQKEYQADIFGFGEIVYRKYFPYWKQVKDHWNEVFSQASIEIQVKSSIRRSGLIKGATTPAE